VHRPRRQFSDLRVCLGTRSKRAEEGVGIPLFVKAVDTEHYVATHPSYAWSSPAWLVRLFAAAC
jgi:hypothetical protein